MLFKQSLKCAKLLLKLIWNKDTMKDHVKILFFGLFKDIMGKKEFELSLENPIDFKEFLKLFRSQQEKFSAIYNFIEDKDEKQPVFIVLNSNIIKKPYDFTISGGDELAFLPPVGGG